MTDKSTLSSEVIYDGRVVHLFLETVRLPDGKTAKREIIHHPGAVAIVPFDADGNVILVRQFRQAARAMLIEIPAGTLEPGEDPLACAIRELQEEIGYKPGKINSLGGIYTAPGYTSEFIHLYIASDLIKSRLAHDADEFIEVLHVPLDEAIQMIGDARIADGKTVSGLLLAKARHV